MDIKHPSIGSARLPSGEVHLTIMSFLLVQTDHVFLVFSPKAKSTKPKYAKPTNIQKEILKVQFSN
jgi:hypothetical protein